MNIYLYHVGTPISLAALAQHYFGERVRSLLKNVFCRADELLLLRAQFHGDPRHLPYKDCFRGGDDFADEAFVDAYKALIEDIGSARRRRREAPLVIFLCIGEDLVRPSLRVRLGQKDAAVVVCADRGRRDRSTRL